MPSGACNDLSSKLRVVIALQSTDCPSPIADFTVASPNQKTWTTVLEQGTNPLSATLTCNDGSGGPDLTLAITDPTGCIPASVALTINSLDPFNTTGSETVDKQTCGCTGTGSVGLSVVVEGDAVPAGFKAPAADICPVPVDDSCSCETGGGGFCGSDGCIGTTLSEAPIRCATGEVVLRAVDWSLEDYGVPWGHSRSFESRLNFNENVGNGFNWQVKEWRHVVEKTDGSARPASRGSRSAKSPPPTSPTIRPRRTRIAGTPGPQQLDRDH